MSMPEGVAKALPFLERALGLQPSYARAHGHLAVCHHTLYLRGGLREENCRAAIEQELVVLGLAVLDPVFGVAGLELVGPPVDSD